MQPQEVEVRQAARRKPDISCHSCRRRKVRCDRERPRCQACEQTNQDCEYPLGPMKPGPKIGTLQRRKRKRRDDQADASAQTRRENLHSPGLVSGDGGRAEGEQGCAERGAEQSSPPSNTTEQWSPWSRHARESGIKPNDLSFILHPSHDASTPEKDQLEGKSGGEAQQHFLTQACNDLGLCHEFVDEMIRLYFTNMVAINLFHEPSFRDKLEKISSRVQARALLASMMSYAARFHPAEGGLSQTNTYPAVRTICPPPDHFLDIALKLIDESLKECGDEPPTLCILQALIIATHCQLTRGVHGRAWRSLGMCVRLAYELNLHLIDARGNSHRSDASEPVKWRDGEEKRRAWWAIWEMDVFASTIRRTPTAMDWRHMETLLPVDDADWFNDRPAPSAFMDSNPIQRWKTLQGSGNQSPKAWFMVVNSLMKDAQKISDPRGVRSDSDFMERAGTASQTPIDERLSPVEDARQRLEMLANAVKCFTLALPQHLRYRNQYLSFDPPHSAQTEPRHQLHCGIYNIFVMTQLAQLMIYRHYLLYHPVCTGRDNQAGKPQGSSSLQVTRHISDDPSVQQYFEAADNIVTIVNRSFEEHVKYINPFLLSTIWLACAVQLVRRFLGSRGVNQGLIKSRFDVLYLTYKTCASFWDAKTSLQENLESIEAQLESHFQEGQGGRPRTCYDSPNEPSVEEHTAGSSWVRARPSSESPDHRGRNDIRRTAGVPDEESSDILGTPSETTIFVQCGSSTTNYTGNATAAVCPDGPSMGFPSVHQQQFTSESPVCPPNYGLLLPPSPATTHNANEGSSVARETLAESVAMPHVPSVNPPVLEAGAQTTMGVVQQDNLEWWLLDFPVDLRDLLVGVSAD